jgi:hypothetical protein
MHKAGDVETVGVVGSKDKQEDAMHTIRSLLVCLLLAASALGQSAPPPAALPAFPGDVLFNSHPTFLAGVKVDHPDLTYREGDKLVVEFTAQRESYLYLLYHQADGGSYLLFPNEARTDNRIAAERPVTIPTPGEAFRFRVRPPFGREVLQVVATLKPAPELDSLVAKTGRAAPVSPQVIAKLHDRLKSELASWSEHRVPITTVAKTAELPERKPERFALLIGVNRQKAKKETWIRFKLGAELMAKVMGERGQIEPQHMRTLCDEQATRGNIENAVARWLPSVSKPGDMVFIFYAGHGGTVKNLDGTKPGARDGFLTIYDNDFEMQHMSHEQWEANSRESYITDMALARWLQELSGRQVALVICSCYSGTMIDGACLTKYLAREAARVKGISQLNVSVMTASYPDEESWSPLKAPVWEAQFIAEAMTQLPPPVTFEQAFEYFRDKHRLRQQKQGLAGQYEPLFINNALTPIILTP